MYAYANRCGCMRNGNMLIMHYQKVSFNMMITFGRFKKTTWTFITT